MGKSTNSGTFGVLQRVGRSFMFPIALLPVAGLLLGIGSSFSNPTTIKLYHLEGILGEGSILNTVLSIMAATGDVIFGNLPLIFAMGVALGMAKQEKEIATLSAAVAFLVMHTTIATLLKITGRLEILQEGATGSVLGLTSLEMGVFGGIITGLGVAWLHNRFHKIELPNAISFFGGTRFIPIISTLVYILVGVVMYFLWPVIQNLIYALGNLVTKSGYVGTWIYGIIERALIPFGLHHVFYLPFWHTGLGGTMMIDGVNVAGAQNIFFAQLASPETTRFSVEACRFMTGKFPFMMFGLPGAALAMYQCAKSERKKIAGGLLFGAALTAFLTGITEPLEFTFLFVAPLLYIIHCIFAGLSFMLMHIFGVSVGMTFSGGFIDLLLFGILPGNAKTNWIYIIFVGIVYFAIYYLLFRFLIRKFDYKTPGREEGETETKLYTRKDYNKAKSDTGKNDRASTILEALGGKDNLSDIDCCATRLRITVKEPSKVNDSALKATGASGVIKKGNGIQVIYGPKVTVIKSELETLIGNIE